MAIQQRAYRKVREIIERLGGTMTYQRQGFRYGAWIISLNGKTATIEAPGDRSFKKLDQLHVPKIANPTKWDDYHNELVDGAQKRLLALLK